MICRIEDHLRVDPHDPLPPPLLVVHENDGSWSFHGLGALGVKVSKSDAPALAQGILKAAE
ncbi:MAG: hypothetical protein ACRDTA_27675 [Pseudonocardiaceae bacterium]